MDWTDRNEEVRNALTIDVEDYYQVSAFESVVDRQDWDRYENRVERNTLKLLSILAEHHVQATFFILGWVAERYPQLIREIQREEHEVACHGYAHKLIYQQSPESFRQDIRKAKEILEDLCGEPVIGYRAPSYSITQRSLWALEILEEEGFEYDSSIFPIHHDRYGMPEAHRFPYEIDLPNGGFLQEFPPSTLQFLGKKVPIAGGGYLRLFPYGLTRWGIEQINRKEKQPAIVYLHPWEIDPGQPRLPGSRLSRFRHYVNLDTTEGKLRQLLKDFRFGAVRESIDQFQFTQRDDLT